MAWIENLEAMRDCYVGNIAAIILASMLLVNYTRKNLGETFEKRTIFLVIIIIILYSVIEILSCVLEGIPGTGMYAVLFVMNSALFAINFFLEVGWLQLICKHLAYTISKRTKRMILFLMLAGLILLILNAFYPLVFVMENNRYVGAGPLYGVFVAFGIFCMCYSLYIYSVCKRNGGVLKYFPVWMYIVPVVIGMLLEWWLQSSLMSICNAIALSSVIAGLQREEVFRDRLTGLYNRAYLEEIKEKLGHTMNPYVSGIMLDLNNFKSVNDNFGHAEGDQALILASGLIREGVGSHGDVIRYAGDEFVVILNTWDKEKLKECADRITASFEAFNAKKRKPYLLTASMGYASFNAGTQTVNEFLNIIDRNMYKEKRIFYSNQNNDRRRNWNINSNRDGI